MQFAQPSVIIIKTKIAEDKFFDILFNSPISYVYSLVLENILHLLNATKLKKAAQKILFFQQIA